MAATATLVELAKHLKEEKLFVSSEKEQLRRLNEEVTSTAERLYHVSWIARQQRQNLDQLIFGAWEPSPAACCYRANALEQVNFEDAYKQLGYQDSAFGEFVKKLRENPRLVAYCLTQGERLHLDGSKDIVKIIMSAVYGNCIMQEDERYVLLLLQALIESQLAGSDDPRRLLRKGSCVFTKVFKQFTEGLYSGRLYLTAALHEAVMVLLMDDENFLETNPHKVTDHFTPQEQEKRFGKANTPEFQDKLLHQLEVNVDQLVNHCNRFIQSLKDNMYCFPQSLDWIVKQIYKIVTQAGKSKAEEVRAMCVDMLLLLFVCPAIVNPEPYGITSDILISDVARFNLMQVAQILQALAMKMYTAGDGRGSDICSRFSKDCMSSFLDSMINSVTTEDIPPVNHQLEGITRSSALITQNELYALVAYLRSVQASCPDQAEGKELETMLSSVPATPSPTVTLNTPSTPQSNTSSFPLPSPSTPTLGSAKKSHGKGRKTVKSPIAPDPDIQADANNQQRDQSAEYKPDDVLVLQLGNIVNECPGMLSETKVVASAEAKTKSKPEETEHRVSPSLHADIPEKQLRFSADASLVSDNLESMSIGASNSVYSMDLENISNTSGIENASCASGRNTPRSTASSSDAARALEMLESEPHDISDRFGKFEIRTIMDKDKSQMDAVETWSETWSTDVLASDQSEPPPEPNPIERLQEIAEVQSEPPDYPGAHSLLDVRHPGEVSETASETWSVDVLQSDTERQEERLQELDDGNYENVVEGDILEDSQEGKQEQEDQFFDAIDNSTKKLEMLGTSDELENLGAVGGMGVLQGEPLHYGGNKASSHGERRPLNDLAQSFMNTGSSKKENQDNVIDTFDPFAPVASSSSTLTASQSHRDSGISVGTNSVSPSTPENATANPEESPMSPTQNNGHTNPAFQMETAPPVPPKRRNNPFDRESARLVNQDSVHYSTHAAAGNHPGQAGKATYGPGMLIPDGVPSAIESGSSDVTKSRASSSASTSSNSSGYGVNRIPEPDVQKSISFENSVESLGSQEKIEGIETPDKTNKSWWKKKLPFKVPTRKGKGSKTPDKDREHSSMIPHSLFHHEAQQNHQQQHADSDTIKPQQAFSMPGSGGEEILSKYKNMAISGQNVEVAGPEEILNKYRHKLDMSSSGNDGALVNLSSEEHEQNGEHGDHTDGAIITGDNIESTYPFTDAKRKLRIVLCSADFHTLPWLTNFSTAASQRINLVGNPVSGSKENNDNELVAFLKVQLAEAINLQDKSLIAQLHETLRCVRQFDADGSKKLLHSLQQDYLNRSPYISYLVRSRKGLLATKAHLERLLERVERDKTVCNKYFTAQCVRHFLERQETAVQKFVDDFKELTVSDEKTDHVEEFLHYLYTWISQDPIWQAASEEQKEDAQVATERAIMSSIYKLALYPNGDGDSMRDQVLHDYIKKLSKSVTASHKALLIPEKYRKESPWPSAQAEILTINAYKTPKDKLQCVMRCCSTIMNLLSMANENSVPGADDFVPVLVYVLIKANPPSLLSTIQYVNSFYDKRLSGEEQYWWMQFCAAIEFIKTID
ncbi:GTPase-activating protein and VPS9 domain-containing protein 1-like [Ptychodera flava]|uniref:GTPase-activating protein and VPS9 domain-containing protein 1-like n=1 Tax=Ptychodera flava TaxID=63121 RepID=UPI00396A57C8